MADHALMRSPQASGERGNLFPSEFVPRKLFPEAFCSVRNETIRRRVVPDQFCEQFFEQNIDFPAEKKLLAKCEQNIEILMKIDPKASQSGDTISFFSNVLYGTCLTTGRWRRSRSSGRGLSVRTMYNVYRSTTRTRMYTDRRVEAIASDKVPTKRSNAEQYSSKISVK